MLLSQKAKVMRVHPMDVIKILEEYVTVTYGIYYRNGYPDPYVITRGLRGGSVCLDSDMRNWAISRQPTR